MFHAERKRHYHLLCICKQMNIHKNSYKNPSTLHDNTQCKSILLKMSLNYLNLLLFILGAVVLTAPSLALRYPNHKPETKYNPISLEYKPLLHQPAEPVLIPDQHPELSRKLVIPWKPKLPPFLKPKPYKPFKKRPPTYNKSPPPPRYVYRRPGHPPAADSTAP